MTYIRRIMELADTYCPESRIFTSGEEARTVKDALGLDEMQTELELRNMRDMTVLYYDRMIDTALAEDDHEDFDRLMSAMQSITAVIDSVLWNRGYGV